MAVFEYIQKGKEYGWEYPQTAFKIRISYDGLLLHDHMINTESYDNKYA